MLLGWFVVLVALTAGGSGCVSSELLPTGILKDRASERPTGSSSRRVGARPLAPADRERPLLLLIEDRRMWEPVTIDRALLAATTSSSAPKGDVAPGVDPKERLALALGRIGDREGLLLLEEFLLDPRPEIRRSAAFSFLAVARRGALPTAFSRPERGLYGAVSDLDTEVAALALQALAASGSSLGEVLAAIERRSASLASSGRAQNELDVWAVLVPALSLMEDQDRLRAALLGLERLQGVSEIEAGVLEARLLAALLPVPADLKPRDRAALQNQMRRTLEHPEEPLRQLAARLAAEVGERSDLEALVRALLGSLEAPELATTSPATAAVQLESLERLLRRGVAVPPLALLPVITDLVEGTDSAAVRVRLAAIDMADLWLLEERLDQSLVSLVEAGFERVEARTPTGSSDPSTSHLFELARRALLALARAEHPRAAELVLRASRQSTGAGIAHELRSLRVAAAEAAGLIGLREPLDRLAGDSEPAVRARVLEARSQLLEISLEEKKELLSKALEDPSTPVRRAAYRLLEKEPILELTTFARGLDRLPADSLELRLAAVDAALALASGGGYERGGTIALLEQLAEDPAYPVRKAAARALEQLERPVTSVASPRSMRGPDYYRGIVQVTYREREALLETTAGTLRLRFHCPAAPQSCVSILQLAEQSFYDGLPFYRPEEESRAGERCLIATGDPQGDRYGGPGYRVVDEPVPLLVESAGRVLLDATVPDAGSSRLLFSRCARSDLAGAQPVVASIVEGLEVLQSLTEGDVVVSLREVP